VATDTEFEALLGHPIPIPRSQRPFTRTSTAADLATSRRGRILVAAVRWGIQRKFAATETGNMDDLTEAVLAELPLRAIATSSPVSLAALDRMIASLNNDVRGVLRPSRPRGGSPGADGARE
jgi:hypothetical protein